MWVLILLLVFIAVLIGAMVVMYLDLKKVKLDRGKLREDFKEFEKALSQAQEYRDGEGWISIKWVDRDRYFEKGSR